MPRQFVHTNVHSDYSLLDGIAKIDKLVKKAKECGQTAIALTDHGTLAGSIEFWKACVANEIKPILGCELYLSRGRTRLASGDWAGALEDAANLTRLDLEDPRAQLLRAEIWLAEGREAEARAALDLAAAEPCLITFGIRPTRPETGYGYVEAAEAVAGHDGVYRVGAFTEKPPLETAREYLESGRHWWNSGMFCWRSSTVDGVTGRAPSNYG